ncbi:hypothetical protein FB451DRAFT_1189053 [Mycena latifolia]|nr:hypothetical protein FB451DRAFT_1189053 [Mycena latifolia]
MTWLTPAFSVAAHQKTGCAKPLRAAFGFCALCKAACGTSALKLLVLTPAPGGRRKCGKWLKNALFGQKCGHSRTAAVAKPNNDVKVVHLMLDFIGMTKDPLINPLVYHAALHILSKNSASSFPATEKLRLHNKVQSRQSTDLGFIKTHLNPSQALMDPESKSFRFNFCLFTTSNEH